MPLNIFEPVEPFISNPDLVERLQNNWELTPPNRALHYGLGTHGYTDWKTFNSPVSIQTEIT